MHDTTWQVTVWDTQRNTRAEAVRGTEREMREEFNRLAKDYPPIDYIIELIHNGKTVEILD